MNNASIFTADRATHFKVVVIALAASALVVLIGMSARPTPTTTARDHMDVPFKAGPPTKTAPSMLAARQPTTEIR